MAAKVVASTVPRATVAVEATVVVAGAATALEVVVATVSRPMVVAVTTNHRAVDTLTAAVMVVDKAATVAEVATVAGVLPNATTRTQCSLAASAM